MSRFFQILRLSCLLVSLVIISTGCKMCAKPPAVPQGALDTPGKHIEWGYENLEKGKLDEAYREFQRALQLKPEDKDTEKIEKAPAYAGLGIYYAMKSDFKLASEKIKKAKSLDSNCWQAFMAYGRILSLKKSIGWFKNADKSFKKSVKLAQSDNDKSMVYYWWGKCAKSALELNSAEKAFARVIELDVPGWIDKADTDWKLIQMIRRAAPGTDAGKKIALIEKLSRADCTVLFMQELNLEKLLSQRVKKEYDTKFNPPQDAREFTTETEQSAPQVTDIEDHWAKHDIEKIINLPIRGLQPYQDHTFKPHEFITRASFATMIQDVIIIISGDDSLSRKFMGDTSEFPDVRSDHYAFNAIRIVVSRGILETKGLQGEFGLKDSVSGAEALLAIRKLRDNLRI